MTESVTSASHSLIRSGATMFCALSAGGVLAILISISVARSVSVSDFGIYALVVSIQNVAIIFAGFSIGPAMAKFVAEYRARDSSQAREVAKIGLSMVLLFSLIACSTYVILAPYIGEGLYNESAIVDLIPLSALTVSSNALYFTTYGIVQGYQRIRFLGLMHILTPLMTLITIPVLIPTMGVGGVFLGYFISQLTVTTAAWFYIKTRRLLVFPHEAGWKNPRTARRILGFAVPGVMSSSMLAPVVWLANTELAIDVGFEAMGYFAVAFVFYQAILVVPRSVVIPLIPKISELSVQLKSEIQEVVIRPLRFLGVVLFPIMFGIALFSRSIVEFLYGSYYVPATQVVYLMVVATYFYTMASVVGGILSGTGRMWLAFSLNGIWAGIFLAIIYTAIPMWGLTGIGVAFVGSYCCHMMISYAVSDNVLHVNLNRTYLNIVLASVLFLIGYIVMEFLVDWNWGMGVLMLVIGGALVAIEGREIVVSLLNWSLSLVGRLTPWRSNRRE